MLNCCAKFIACIVLVTGLTGCQGFLSTPISDLPQQSAQIEEAETKLFPYTNEQVEKAYLEAVNDHLWYHPDFLEYNPQGMPPRNAELSYEVWVIPEKEELAAMGLSNLVFKIREGGMYQIRENSGGFRIDFGSTAYPQSAHVNAIKYAEGNLIIPESATKPSYGGFSGKEKIIERCENVLIEEYTRLFEFDKMYGEYEFYIRDFYPYDESIEALMYEKEGDLLLHISILLANANTGFEDGAIDEVFSKEEMAQNDSMTEWFDRIKEAAVAKFTLVISEPHGGGILATPDSQKIPEDGTI